MTEAAVDTHTPRVIRRGVRPGPAENAPAGNGRALTPMASLRAHARLAAGAAAVVLAAGLPYAYIKGRPQYQATAVIQVAPRFAATLTGADDKELELQSNTQYREFVQQQVRSINRYDIVDTALTALTAQGVPWARPTETHTQSVERLQWSLDIKPVPDTYLIQISQSGDEREPLAPIVNTVVATFLATAKREELYDSDDRIQQLEQELKQIEPQLNSLLIRRTGVAADLGVTTFNENTRNPYDELLLAARAVLATARSRRADAEARASAIDATTRKEGDAALAAAADEFVSHDSGLAALKSGLYQRRTVLLAKESGLAADYPGRAAIDQELHEIDADITAATTKLRQEFEAMIRAQRESELFASRRAERDAEAQVDLVSSQSRSFAAKYQDAVILGGEIDRLRKRQGAIADRIDFLRLETQAPGYFRLITPARLPETPVSGGRKKLGAVVLAVALIVGAAVAIGRDYFDSRIQTAGEVAALAGFPPIGVVARPALNGAAADDGLGRAAGALLRDRRAFDTRVITCTSAADAATSGAVAAALATDLHNRGLSVLLLRTADAVPTSPADPTFAALLDGAPMPTSHRGLIDAAAGPDLRRALAVDGAFERLLGTAATHVDVVLVAAPALDGSAGALPLAAHADLVLLVAEAGRTTRRQFRAALGELDVLQPAAVGTVLVTVGGSSTRTA